MTQQPVLDRSSPHARDRIGQGVRVSQVQVSRLLADSSPGCSLSSTRRARLEAVHR